MDPVTAVGAVSAVVSIVSDLQHLCSKLRRFAKSLKHAPAELEMVINETEIFWQLLDRFHDLVEEDDDFPNDGFQANIQSINISKRIAHASRYSYEKLRDMLAKFEPIRPRSDTSIRAKLQKWLALWQFYGWKDEWAQIQLSMSSTKQNAQLLLELVSFETLLHKMKTMQLGNNAVPGKVEKLMMRL